MAAGTHAHTKMYFLLESVSAISLYMERGDRFAGFQIKDDLSIAESRYEVLLKAGGSK